MRLHHLALIAAAIVSGQAPAADSFRLKARDVQPGTVALAFKAAGADRGYVLERRAGDGPWRAVAEIASRAKRYEDRELKPGSAYAYRLVGVDEVETRVIRGGEPAEAFSVDLRGAGSLTLVTTAGGDGNGNDHAVWGSPALVRADGTRVALAGVKPRSFQVGWDRVREPSALTIGGTEYPESIWAHAPSRMVLDLDGEDVRFEAMVGVDSRQEDRGSVTFKARVTTGRVSDAVAVKTKALIRSPGNTTYYVNGSSGKDSNPGTSPRRPWKTLDRVNAMRFAAGDAVLFKAGSRYRGQLRPRGSGAKGAPVVVDLYGGANKARIDGRGTFKAAVLLHNVEYWTVRNLEVTNTGKKREPGRTGVRVSIHDFGVAHDIRLDGLHVHDVNGSNVKQAGGGSGIDWSNGGSATPSTFDGLTIERCHLVRCDRNGIIGNGYWRRQDWHPSLNVVIRGNLLEDIGGDGIVPIGTDGCLIERNILRGGRMRCEDYAAGIWPWSCDNTLIQYNEVSGMRGTKDGQGFDSDYNCRNSVFQYNYSHDNDGGFMLICDSGERGYSIGNTGTIVRYNISQNDGERLFQFGGPTRGTTVHNNVFYVREGLDILGVFHNDWNGWSDDVKFYNNVFYADGRMRHEPGKSTNNVYADNVFFGNHENLPDGVEAAREDPRLVDPGGGADGLDSVGGYKLQERSPLRGAGRPVTNNADEDFWGNPLPGPGKKLAVGAHQPD